MQTISIKPAAGACSLGQGAYPKTGALTLSVSEIRKDIRKDRVPDHHAFRKAHGGAPPTGPARPDGGLL